MLNVICWLWRSTGWRTGYNYMHVNALERMLDKHLKIPHRLICVTDQPQNINCQTVPLWDKPKVKVQAHMPNCYRRLWLFSEEAKEKFGDVILSIDLDCVILRDITPIIDTSLDFKINEGIICPYNGAMWLLRLGSHSYVWDLFDPEVSPGLAAQQRNKQGRNYFGSDQAWLSYCIDNAPTWGPKDGVYHFSQQVSDKNIKNIHRTARIVFFAGRLKPWMPNVYRIAPQLFRAYQQYLEPKQRSGKLTVGDL